MIACTSSGQRFDVILTNPPFDTTAANQAPTRDDFTIETDNKQLNFVRHVVNVLKPGGRAAMLEHALDTRQARQYESAKQLLARISSKPDRTSTPSGKSGRRTPV